MEASIHFIFELFKIGILSSVYALVMLLVFRSIASLKPNSWINRVSFDWKKFWIRTGQVISIGLFIFMFTYWGDHGLGDESFIPVGYHNTINQSDESSYIENKRGKQLNIVGFIYDDNRLYAKKESTGIDSAENYVVWDLKTDAWQIYKTKNDYLTAAKENQYSTPDKFKNFGWYYDKYWNGWRFWLLP